MSFPAGQTAKARRAARIAPALLVLALAACGGEGDGAGDPQSADSAAEDSATAAASSSPRLPACRKPADPTPAQTEGPYYKPGSPRRRSLLVEGVSGRRLVVRGRVLSTACRPVAGVRVDLWQADGNGEYDNDGYGLRGYQLTDSKGRYRVSTVVPGRYEPRTPHIHVKVTPPGGETLTTQLYLPGESRNRSDTIFEPETVMRLRRGSAPWRAAFDFVVPLASRNESRT